MTDRKSDDETDPMPTSPEAADTPPKNDNNPTVNTPEGLREPPPTGYAREGNYDQMRSFETGTHDPSPAPVAGFDPKYGNNPYKGGFHPDRLGNERDHMQPTIRGEIIPPETGKSGPAPKED
jgi:hypothetical protein